MTGHNEETAPRRLSLIVAFGAVYLIWGSTYLAIRFAIETLPPFLMAGTRFAIAGGILYAAARALGAAPPRPVHWRSAAVIGALLLLGGNGGVVWAEQTVPSGLTALIVAIVPLWMVLFDWLRGTGPRPGPGVALGLLLGFVGVGLLVGPGELAGGGRIDPIGAAVVVFASLLWAFGSLYSRRAELPTSQSLATAMEMLAGGGLLLIAAAGTGELTSFRPSAASARSLWALAYLILFGAIIAFSAYVWLLRTTTPARAATYAYVNPVIAVILGWALAGEPLGPRILFAGAMIVTAVMLIVGKPRRRGRGAASGAPPEAPERPAAGIRPAAVESAAP
ncbi:MAG: drug/metabolite exporter YedA [Gemmatimonadota bacterium]|jgi:drug/metabolite transporter (DMT)-like permease|nr:MAG: drug/metabolite exporter YedA [Gemmatimonadota bacterium]